MNQLVDRFYVYRIRTHRDAEAFGRLYDRYVTHIYRFVYLKLPSKEAAEDVTSETFLRFWQYALEQTEIRNVRALLYKFARNLVVDHYRKREPATPLSSVVTESGGLTSSDSEGVLSDHNRQRALIEAKADFSLVLEKIGRLKEDYCDVLTLRLVDGLGYQDIALILDKTPGHVRVIYHRAMKALDALDRSQPTP
ncbi:sigma-70 family RNA polymerase sigma factor [Candidatus Uhrbacteria bacterium]|nr:MAG: sigma-70 family RNA polymerase sigma factor [Candidatus Uhrbacteria bacterium]